MLLRGASGHAWGLLEARRWPRATAAAGFNPQRSWRARRRARSRDGTCCRARDCARPAAARRSRWSGAGNAARRRRGCGAPAGLACAPSPAMRRQGGVDAEPADALTDEQGGAGHAAGRRRARGSATSRHARPTPRGEAGGTAALRTPRGRRARSLRPARRRCALCAARVGITGGGERSRTILTQPRPACSPRCSSQRGSSAGRAAGASCTAYVRTPAVRALSSIAATISGVAGAAVPRRTTRLSTLAGTSGMKPTTACADAVDDDGVLARPGGRGGVEEVGQLLGVGRCPGGGSVSASA